MTSLGFAKQQFPTMVTLLTACVLTRDFWLQPITPMSQLSAVHTSVVTLDDSTLNCRLSSDSYFLNDNYDIIGDEHPNQIYQCFLQDGEKLPCIPTHISPSSAARSQRHAISFFEFMIYNPVILSTLTSDSSCHIFMTRLWVWIQYWIYWMCSTHSHHCFSTLL